MAQSFSGKQIINSEKQDFVNILKMVAPGTSMRSALNDILRAGMGALIVIESDGLFEIVEKGFRINSRFNSQRVVELAKMDGAIILSKDLKKILYANALLFPDVTISTRETGTRHKAAERTAKQTNAVVIAISERKNKITLYYGNGKYELEPSSEILRKATETLQILEKQIEIFYEAKINLNLLEITNFVTTDDVCKILQKIAIIKKVSDVIRNYLVELGVEGVIVSMRLKELTKNILPFEEILFKDYFESKLNEIKPLLEGMSLHTLLETPNLSKELFGELHDKLISSKGVRILSKTSLSKEKRELLMEYYGSLDKVFDADEESLVHILVDENLAKTLKKELETLREKVFAGKKI